MWLCSAQTFLTVNIVVCTAPSEQGNCCTKESPCKLGGGDCDKDDDCEGSLVCGLDNCQDFTPAATSASDCCIKPSDRSKRIQNKCFNVF